MILKLARHVTASQAIRRSIGKRLDAWEAGQHQILVKEMYFTCNQYLSASLRDESEEHQENTFQILMLMVKLRTAVRWIIE